MIGILQGRLTPPWNGRLQCFPKDWEAEFELARKAGFEAIEALVEGPGAGDNPVWSEEGTDRLRRVSGRSCIAVRVACADCFMEIPFLHAPDQALEMLAELAIRDFELIVLPFFAGAELRGQDDLDRLADVLLGSGVPADRLAIETTLSAELMASFVDRTGIGVCYDLGNATALGHDVGRDIRLLGRRIVHVHVKDKRKSDGQNVLLGTGDTDFESVARALHEIRYEGDYTCECARGNDPFETAMAHAAFVRHRLPGAST